MAPGDLDDELRRLLVALRKKHGRAAGRRLPLEPLDPDVEVRQRPVAPLDRGVARTSKSSSSAIAAARALMTRSANAPRFFCSLASASFIAARDLKCIDWTFTAWSPHGATCVPPPASPQRDDRPFCPHAADHDPRARRRTLRRRGMRVKRSIDRALAPRVEPHRRHIAGVRAAIGRDGSASPGVKLAISPAGHALPRPRRSVRALPAPCLVTPSNSSATHGRSAGADCLEDSPGRVGIQRRRSRTSMFLASGLGPFAGRRPETRAAPTSAGKPFSDVTAAPTRPQEAQMKRTSLHFSAPSRCNRRLSRQGDLRVRDQRASGRVGNGPIPRRTRVRSAHRPVAEVRHRQETGRVQGDSPVGLGPDQTARVLQRGNEETFFIAMFLGKKSNSASLEAIWVEESFPSKRKPSWPSKRGSSTRHLRVGPLRCDVHMAGCLAAATVREARCVAESSSLQSRELRPGRPGHCRAGRGFSCRRRRSRTSASWQYPSAAPSAPAGCDGGRATRASRRAGLRVRKFMPTFSTQIRALVRSKRRGSRRG